MSLHLRPRRKWSHLFVTLAAAGVISLLGTPARAQCFDSSKHLRSGQWHQWVLQLTPGPDAQTKVEQVINEINAARLVNNLPLLTYDKSAAIAVGFIDENNGRGPNGEPLVNHLSNQEIFFATFASLPFKHPVVVFLTDPLRSSADLIAAGVPGRAAVFATDVNIKLQGRDSAVTTKWLAQNGAGDRIQFSAQYASADVASRGSGPSADGYLECGMSSVFSVVFRLLPLQTFLFFDLIQTSVIRDFANRSVAVELKVQLADPIVNAIFGDPANEYLQLIEAHRVVRIQSQQ